MLTLAMQDWFDYENAVLIGIDGQPVELTRQERLLVRALRPGGLKARDTLVQAVWPDENATPVSAYERALEAMVLRLRDKLEQAGYNRQALRERRFLGYQLDEERLCGDYAPGVSRARARRVR